MKSINESNSHENNKKSMLLHHAISDGNTAKAHEYCKKIKNDNISIIDDLNDDGLTPLHIAITIKNEELVDLLLQNGANPNKHNTEGDTATILAVKNNAATILIRLIEEKANLNLCNSQGDTPLKIATDLDFHEIINILSENGAFMSKQNIQNSTLHYTKSQTEDYINNITDTYYKYLKINSKKTTNDFNKLFHSLIKCTNEYIGNNAFSNPKIKNFLNQKILRTFQQFHETSLIDNKLEKKIELNITRKIIVSFDDASKNFLLHQGDNDTVFLMSKAESLIEEEVVNSQKYDSPNNTNDSTIKNHFTINVSKSKEDIKKDWYTRHGYKNFNDFINSHRTIEKNIKHLKFSEITKEQILTRNNKHDVELIDFITIRPRHPRSIQEIKTLFALSENRLEEESILYEQKEILNSSKKFIQNIIKNFSEIQPDDAIKIDKILRPGKAEKVHIINFSDTRYEELWSDLTEEAFETGATIHAFNYQENVEHKNDLIYAGIAAINKVLDEGIAPDKIIIKGYGNGAAIAHEVKNQFEKRSIYITAIDFSKNSFKDIDHRYYCFSNKKTLSTNCPEEIKPCLKYIINNSKDILYDTKKLLSTFNSKIRPFQLINLFIKSSQKLLSTSIKYKNPQLLKERVETIIGFLDKSSFEE